MAVQPRGITQETAALIRMKSEEPLLWLDAVQGNGVRSSTIRLTGELQDTWWGAFIAYHSLENSGIIGTHNSAAQTTADDKVAMIIDRSTGKVKFGDNISRTDAALARVHIEEDSLVMEALSADPSDPGSGRFHIWLSDGTDSGDAGDVMMKINNGVSTKIITLVDFSAA